MAGGWTPKGYRYCTDRYCYSFQDRNISVLQINCSRIREVHITWAFIFHYLFKKKPKTAVVLGYFLQNIARSVPFSCILDTVYQLRVDK